VNWPDAASPAAGIVATALVATALVAACAAAPSRSAPPSSTPRPTPTPVVRLAAPFHAGEVVVALREAGLDVTGNTARAGLRGQEPRTTMFATYESWPLRLLEYSSAAALRKASGFKAGDRIVAGDPPFAFAAANLLIEYGPRRDGKKPARPDFLRQAKALMLVLALHPLVGPLVQRSIVALPLPTPPPAPAANDAPITPAPAATAPAPMATATPAASAAVSP
jgi:hypothetical protein